MVSWNTTFLDCSPDSRLSAIASSALVPCNQCQMENDLHSGSIDMPIACLERFCHGILLGMGILPCSKPNGSYKNCQFVGNRPSWQHKGCYGRCSRISAPVLSLNLVLRVAMVRVCGSRWLDNWESREYASLIERGKNIQKFKRKRVRVLKSADGARDSMIYNEARAHNNDVIDDNHSMDLFD